MSVHQSRITSFLARGGLGAGFRGEEVAPGFEVAWAGPFAVDFGFCRTGMVLADRSLGGSDFGLLWPAVLEGSAWDAAALAARASLRSRLLR